MISRRFFLGAAAAAGFAKPERIDHTSGYPCSPPKPQLTEIGLEQWWERELLPMPKGYTHHQIYTMKEIDYNRLLAGYPAPRNDDFNLWWPL